MMAGECDFLLRVLPHTWAVIAGSRSTTHQHRGGQSVKTDIPVLKIKPTLEPPA
jgi:hypothetical protein